MAELFAELNQANLKIIRNFKLTTFNDLKETILMHETENL